MNYRKIPKGSLLDEDSDSFDDDEWDKANKSWDSFEVSFFELIHRITVEYLTNKMFSLFFRLRKKSLPPFPDLAMPKKAEKLLPSTIRPSQVARMRAKPWSLEE